MARLTVRLPDSLHEALAQRAKEEGVSLNHYLVYMLAQATAVDAVRHQRAQFNQMRSRFTDDEAETALQELLDSRE